MSESVNLDAGSAAGHPLSTDPDVTPYSVGKRRNKRSKAWMHFTVQKDDPDHACCNYCNVVLGCKSTSAGTASLVNHLKICKKNPVHICSTQGELTYQVCLDGNSLVPWLYNEKEVREALARMIVVDELPFMFAENEGFRFFMSKACPRFTVPSRTTMYRDIIALYEVEKAKLRKYFIDSRHTVCLTTDTWTSKRQQSYMVLTAHFIDSRWKLRKKIISFVLVDGHKGDEIGKSLEKLLIEWGIERVCTISVDNASSNDTCLAYMKRSLANRGCTHVRSQYLHMRCVAHIVNLVVQDGLKIMCHPVNRIRNASKFVRASPTRLDVFKKCVQLSKVASKGLINIDVATRWNSTFLMLDTAEKFERAFEQYALHDPNYKIELERTGPEPKPDTPDQRGPPTQSNWVYVREFKQFLQHFYDLTNKVSGTKYITANTFLEDIADVHFMLGEWSDHVICGDDEIFKCMATKMKAKYEKYWGDPEKMNKYIFIAAILDPRTKESHFFKDMIEDTYGSIIGNRILTSSHNEFVSLFEEYKELYGTGTSESVTQAHGSEYASENSLMRSRYNKKRMRACGQGSTSTNTRTELDKYLAEDTEELTAEFDLLEWWKRNAPRFPVLSKMARDILAIPISTVASKSAFSTSGRILDDFRSSLTPVTLQSLICTQDWLRFKCINVEADLAELTRLEEAPPLLHQSIHSFEVLCSALLPASRRAQRRPTPPSPPRSHAALLAASLACLRDDGEVVVVAAADDEAAAAAARAAVHSVVAGAAGGGAEVQCGVQLRRLDHGHGQPVHQRAPLGDHLHAAALRRDLLREPHLPLLRRPRHRRLPQHQVRPPLPAPLQVHLRRLQEGRQHGHHRRHRHGRPLLPLPRPLRQDLEQRAHQLPAPVVPDHHLLRLRQQLQELPGQLALHLRGVRGERLQRDAVRQLQHGPGEHVRAADRGHHRRRRGEAAGAGRGGRGGAGGAPHRLLPHLPHHLRHLQCRRLRLPRLPQEVQRPLHVPQQPAADQGVVPPGQVQVGAHHVRRLLRRRLRHGPEPQQIRFQLGVPGVLRVGGRQVQLRQQRAVRHVRRLRLRQPGVAPQLGRHPPHRSRLQADHRRLAQRRLLPPRHHPLATPPHGHQLRSARSLHGRIKKRIVVHGSIINQSIDYYYYYLFSRVNYTMFSGDWLRLGSLPV